MKEEIVLLFCLSRIHFVEEYNYFFFLKDIISIRCKKESFPYEIFASIENSNIEKFIILS